jgi:hypothetical protein
MSLVSKIALIGMDALWTGSVFILSCFEKKIVHIWEYKGYPGHKETMERLEQDPVSCGYNQ